MTYGGGVYKPALPHSRRQRDVPVSCSTTPRARTPAPTAPASPGATTTATGSSTSTTKKLIDPPKSKSFEIQCASCHFTGYTLTPTVEGSFVAGAVNDPNGELDIDGDGVPNELNIGCETCHGPGSAHSKAPLRKKASYIVSPNKLAAERSMVICNQCHSRPQGTMKNDTDQQDNRMHTPATAATSNS